MLNECTSRLYETCRAPKDRVISFVDPRGMQKATRLAETPQRQRLSLSADADLGSWER